MFDTLKSELVSYDVWLTTLVVSYYYFLRPISVWCFTVLEEIGITLTKCISYADLLNVFEVFLPQLLLYPNPSDPLNGDAASLMMKDKALYEQKVKGTSHFSSRYKMIIVKSVSVNVHIRNLLHQSTASATRRSRTAKTAWATGATRKWATTRRTATGGATATTKSPGAPIPKNLVIYYFVKKNF